ncbi:MAG: type II toxin-antitoxin system VapC family toxin [Sulfurimonas sp.]|uniref:type II toxin-antitoxin system VapC family toxin n=1 Tax=Sulfurimonas sp. TaxID=2022749 RepID=UPI002633EF51|nr:type II toxin-antitoxin system VapC family toxin [Sulfurimonas sp.]MDD5399896.1 type II toxin-antitoxin system VapC family toxin [Sulfurimonas sp.]
MIEKSRYLIDSNIIIYHLNSESIATNFLKDNLENLYISRLTFIEVLSFDFTDEEKEQVIELLRKFEIIDTSDEIALKCVENRKLKKIKLADNIIASTVQVNNLILVTRNVKDFNNLDIQILNIFYNN